MMDTPVRLQPTVAAPLRSQSIRGLLVIPLYVYATIFSSLCIIVGLIWDISWHTSIGRDDLLSPPHLVIYLGAVVSGVFSGYQVLKTTFAGSTEEKGNRYGSGGFSTVHWALCSASGGPLPCSPSLLSTTGGTIPTDWTYRFFPHTVLVLGMIMVQFGAMVGALALQNRREKPLNMDAEAIRRRDSRARLLFVIAAGLLLVSLHTIASEYLERWMMYHSLFY